jgi:hypothetical protein
VPSCWQHRRRHSPREKLPVIQDCFARKDIDLQHAHPGNTIAFEAQRAKPWLVMETATEFWGG